ncbi:MAG: hypothetical protein ONB24_01685 [candidate division KSB1 bacterium]|nr:hypothetical protein [candidate division KSB1 bacterium]
MKTLPRKHLPLFVLLAIAFLYLLPHVNHFYVPASDFFDIDEKAKLLQSFSWPKDFKRPPLFPLLTALLAAPFAGKYAVLYVAELLTLASALGALFFLYRISERLIGNAAFWIAWLWIIHPSTLLMAVKPKPDMAALFCILWAFDWYLQGNKKAFFPASLATLLRYEGAVAIAAFFTADFLFSRQKLRSFLLSILSGSFIVIWTLLHSGGGEGAGYGDYFEGLRVNFDFLKDFAEQLLEIIPLPLKLTSTISVLVGLFGFYRIFRVSRQAVASLTVYAAGFIAMHLIWPFPSRDYGVLGVWVFILFIIAGILTIVEKAAASRRSSLRIDVKVIRLVAAATFVAVIFLFIRQRLVFHPLAVVGFVLVAALYLSGKESVFHSRAALMTLTAAFIVASFSLSLSKKTFEKIKIEKAEYRLVGEWFEKHRLPGEKMAVDQPAIVSYFTSLDKANDFIRLVDLPKVDPDSLAEWLCENRAAYIVWFTSQKMPQNPDAWTRWKFQNRGWQTVAFLEGRNAHPAFLLADSVGSGKSRAFIFRLNCGIK